jgi:hypothetical protein
MVKIVNVFSGYDDEFRWSRIWAVREHDNPIKLYGMRDEHISVGKRDVRSIVNRLSKINIDL